MAAATQATVFQPDAKVFVKNPTKSWLPGTVVSRNEKGLHTVVDDDGEELQKISADDLTPCRDDLLNEGVDPVVHDLLFLTVLHDATLLRCLKVRYMKNIVYTNIGAIVVALNPFNFNIPWYLDSEMTKYLEEGDVIRQNLPHSWAVAHNTYYEMMNDKKNQTILVSGESGAGKTEACKMVLKYLGSLSMKRATPEQVASAEQIRERIQKASPILEGFGNAKTVRNHNSSRFGKFINVKFSQDGAYLMRGAFTTNYLLEKSRIITAAKNERVYHAFYHLTKGRDAKLYGVKPPQDNKATFAGKCIVREDSDDAVDYDEVSDAFLKVGFDAETEVKAIWRAVGGCLIAQNIDLAAIDADTTTIAPSSKPFLAQAAELWGIDAAGMEREILTTTNQVRGEVFTMKLRLAQATDMRDALCKHTYEKLFQALVNKINASTDCEGDFTGSTISVLDIFGFEDFDTGNSFEQLCINLANESLQNHYNNFIFKKDMEECRAEGINVEDVRAPDNSECLKLIVDTQAGIFAFLDEECRLGTGSDDGFLQKVIQNCAVNAYFSFKPLQPGTFIVKHYAGSVTYTVKGFLEKNRDSLKDDMKLLMRASSFPFIASLLPDPADSAAAVGKGKGGAKTVGAMFKQQVADMMNVINSTNPHWIRCVKPHPAKRPLMFDGVQVMNQLSSSGVLGTVKIRKAGYPVRLQFANFLGRYKIIIGKCPSPSAPLPTPQEMSTFVAKACRSAKLTFGKEVQCGKTRVFMKSEAFYELERAKDDAGVTHRVLLQAAARSTVAELLVRTKKWNTACDTIQAEFRSYFQKTAKLREERRIARERLLAAQSHERVMFEGRALEILRVIGDSEEADERQLLTRRFYAEQRWLEEKIVMDAAIRAQFVAAESNRRAELWNEFTAVLQEHVLPRIILNVLATPQVELFKRNRIQNDEMREFGILVQLFSQAGSAMFRVEIERHERRMRRLLLRMEDLQRMEARQRFWFFKEFLDSLYRNARDHVRVLRGVKEKAIVIASRAAARVAVREKKRQVDLFTNRNPRDTTKIERELSQLSVGSLAVVTQQQVATQSAYTRSGDKVDKSNGFAGRTAWTGVLGVPDMDQLLCGATYERARTPNRASSLEGAVAGGASTPGAIDTTPSALRAARGVGGSSSLTPARATSPYDALSRRAKSTVASTAVVLHSPCSNDAGGATAASSATMGPTSPAAYFSTTTMKTTHVFETFRDPMDEMAFLRLRHVVSRELRDLQELGKYDGPFTHETSITCKKKLRLSQDELQRVSATFSEMLVGALRKLNAFCVAKRIPEQDVTGMWKAFTSVPKDLLAEFPPCTDWRRLLAEQRRLHYAAENYRDELVRVIRGCVQRGAKATPVIEALLSYVQHYHDATGDTTSDPPQQFQGRSSGELMSVEAVHRMYAQMKGYFENCSRCLYPMAPKQTLVSMRLLWPKVQDPVFPERCRECMAGVQLSDLTTTINAGSSPHVAAVTDRPVRTSDRFPVGSSSPSAVGGPSAGTPGGPSSSSRRRLSLSMSMTSPFSQSLAGMLSSPSPNRY